MRTNIDIDETLLKDAMEALGVKTKKAAVDEALRRAVLSDRRRQAIKELWGIGWDGDLEELRNGWVFEDRKVDAEP